MKKIFVLSFTLLALYLLASCGNASVPPADNPTTDAVGQITVDTQINAETANAAAITEADAKNAALTHAGVAEADVRFYKVEMGRENGKTVFEVEFTVGDKEYDYEIDSSDGKILSFDYEIETVKPSVSDETESAYITDVRAKEIALAHAGLAESDVRVIRIKFDYDDGRAEYEVEFYYGNFDYEYEIDAVSGEVRSYDREEEKSGAVNGSQQGTDTQEKPTYIGEAAAKEKAFSHAGIREDEAKYLQVEFDIDDGRAVYEVEFEVGRTEYSYEIDAKTGVIRDADIDHD